MPRIDAPGVPQVGEPNGPCSFCGEPMKGRRKKSGPPQEMHPNTCRVAYNDLNRLVRSINKVMITRATNEGRIAVATGLREELQAIRNSDLTPVIRHGRQGKPAPKRKRASPNRKKLAIKKTS